MVHYRRAHVPGGTYFFTVALGDRACDTLIRHIDALRSAFHCVHEARPWRTDAIVVLPDHLHVLWTLPDGDDHYPGRWRAIKSQFVQRLRFRGEPVAVNQRGECRVWQRRYWEHVIRDADDLARHVDYIHINPVKHGLVRRTSEWRWSSFRRYVERGLVAEDWATEPTECDGFGE